MTKSTSLTVKYAAHAIEKTLYYYAMDATVATTASVLLHDWTESPKNNGFVAHVTVQMTLALNLGTKTRRTRA